MSAGTSLKAVDRVEITTVIDNFIEMLGMDSTEIVRRFVPLNNFPFMDWVIAEHGFSAVIKTGSGNAEHSIMMDFGKSEFSVPYNLEAMNLDLGSIEALALSHGHVDHFGGLLNVLGKMPSIPIPLVLHPDAFLYPRYFKFPGGFKSVFSELSREALEAAGAEIIEEAKPRLLTDNTLLFLGEIERLNDFEKGMPLAFFERDGHEIKDDILDDTALVANLKGKGLVILTGCAHAGVINTIDYAVKVTGIERIHAVMGGFHLLGPQAEPLVERTLQEMMRFSPDYVVPCHCTGRKAVQIFEKRMPESFILNQSGTTLSFC
jgi:7,8-dihydropterin-6-yl-methyl-4-(beta-D-ribofuranosyl)aminobenzene 5'-phosphate synthase